MRERERERGVEEKDTERRHHGHRDVARGVSPPTDSRRGSSSFAPSCASTRTGRAGTARRRLVASSARAHASRRARTSPLDCSPRGHPPLPPLYFPRLLTAALPFPSPRASPPSLCPPPRAYATRTRRGEGLRWRSGFAGRKFAATAWQWRVVVIAFPDNCRRVIVDAVSYFPTAVTAARPEW